MPQAMKTILLATSAAALLAAPTSIDGTLPDSKLEVIDPLVETLDELEGRAILVEFFAHW